MPKLSTHLHIALKLSEKFEKIDKNEMFSGAGYPITRAGSDDDTVRLHYREDFVDVCHLDKFLDDNDIEDFNLGWFLHLWTDNYFAGLDMGDISVYDMMICDMGQVVPALQELIEDESDGRDIYATVNLRALEREPLPLYLVSDEKRDRYFEILDKAVEVFCEEFDVRMGLADY